MIAYVRAMDFAYGRADAVSPLITRVVAQNPGPFTFHGTGTYLVGKRSLAVIDPGPDLPAHLDALLGAIDGRPVSHIFTTHTHADHSPLTHPLRLRTGGLIVGRPAPLGEAGERQDRSLRPDVEVVDGQVFEGEGWTIEALATPGHASNHFAYALAEEAALFCGDHVMGWSTTVVSPPDGDMSAYYDSLERVRASGFSTLWPTHGPPVTEVAPFLRGYLEHRLEREGQILRELKRGPRRIAELTPRLYIGVDPRLLGAAGHSLWAHLIHLRRLGRVQSAGEGGLYDVWWPPSDSPG